MIPLLKEMESSFEEGRFNYNNLYNFSSDDKHVEKRMYSIMSKQGFWFNLKPIEAGLELYEYIAHRFETYILTKGIKGCSLAWKEKVDWVHKYIGKSTNMMVVTEKRLVMGDLMYDDLPHNIETWLVNNPKSRAIIPIRHHNVERNRLNDDRVIYWDDSLKKANVRYTKIDGTSEFKNEYDFSGPHKIIDEILKG